MQINRHNYEEFFLLYVDNELSVADRKAVEAFVEQNPDLEEELVMMMQSVLRPDPKVMFTNKESLLKGKAVNGLVNESNYEEYFVLYGDNELSNEEKDLVEQFVYKHPQYQAEFELIQQARLIPDHVTVYPDKNELYRTEDDDRVIPFRWWRIAAAAIVFLFLGITAWFMTNRPAGDIGDTNGSVAETKINTPQSKTKKQDIQQPDVKNSGQLAVVKKDTEKKSVTPSNTRPVKNVTPKSSDLAHNDKVKKMVEQKLPYELVDPVVDRNLKTAYATVVANPIKAPKTDAAAAATEPGSVVNTAEKPVYYYIDENSSDDNIKFASTSINKKPVRGLIRKVKGLFEGNNEEDANDPRPENKKGIRIAAFEIALK